MKALILAAGLGTRLLPYTRHTPKPLFTINGRPLLDILIRRLESAGCEGVMVNTHHLNPGIEAFIGSQAYPIPVITRHEPEILGTGGAIKNAADFWDDRPFLVINADILTDIDLRLVYEFHLRHPYPVTLTLYDDPVFNTVSVNKDGFVTGFDPEAGPDMSRSLTFTGIQVLDAYVPGQIPGGIFFNIMDLYRPLAAAGRIMAFIPDGRTWQDLGTPDRYRAAAVEAMIPHAFEKAGRPFIKPVQMIPLKGDGSDRQWHRLISGKESLIMVDHGIRESSQTAEVDAFVDIGCHLWRQGVSVPRIYHYDRFPGLVFLEDAGDLHLQDRVQDAPDETVQRLYESVIRHLIPLWIKGIQGFDTAWTWQTARYDQEVILEKECRYFVEAFLGRYLGMSAGFEDFQDEFECLAEGLLASSVDGFMHRDMQSRNIMVKNDQVYFIDFQGGRIGPVQYDLASLLIDPYVGLPEELGSHLLEYAIEQIRPHLQLSTETFRKGYEYCRISRNLQILGAFGYLTRVKHKPGFETCIPAALTSLQRNLSVFKKDFEKLKQIVDLALRQGSFFKRMTGHCERLSAVC